MRSQMPPQKTLDKSKEWAEKCVNAIVEMTDFGPSASKDRYFLYKLYDYYNGKVYDEDYEYVKSPYGKARDNFPAQIRNYPIIKPIVDLLLGEKQKRPFNFSVIVTNPDVLTTKEMQKKTLMDQLLMQWYVKYLEEAGVLEELGEEDELPLPEHANQEFERTYKDARAINGQNSLRYIMQKTEFKRKQRKAFFHFLISGRIVTERGVNADEVYYDVLNPLEVDYDKSPDLEFIEDGSWAVVRKMMHLSDVVDYYYEDLSEDEIKALEESFNDGSGSFFMRSPVSLDPGEQTKMHLIEVYRVYWKSMKRIGIITYIDDNGELQEKQVEHGYKLQQDETAEWFWINEVWQGHLIDNRFFKRMEPVPVQRRNMDNLSMCKLPINGRSYSDINSANISLAGIGIAYQLMYNIYHYRLENAIAKSKDVISFIDISLIPTQHGIDMDKFLYYMDALGIAWVDGNAEGFKPHPYAQQVQNMTMQVIKDYISLLESVVQEWERVSGVTRQRQGDIGPYDGKGTSERAIIQSSHITEDYFTKAAELEQRDLQALLDYSKYAWVNGKKAMYLSSDQHQQILAIDGTEHMEAEYGVFVTDAFKETEKLEGIRQLALSMVQSGAPMSIVAEVLDSESFVEIKDKIKKAESSIEQMEQAMMQAQAEQAQADQEFEAMKMENENMNKELDRQNKLDVAMISAGSKMPDQQGQNEQLQAKAQEVRDKLQVEREKISSQQALTTRKLSIEEARRRDDKTLKEKELKIKDKQVSRPIAR